MLLKEETDLRWASENENLTLSSNFTFKLPQNYETLLTIALDLQNRKDKKHHVRKFLACPGFWLNTTREKMQAQKKEKALTITFPISFCLIKAPTKNSSLHIKKITNGSNFMSGSIFFNLSFLCLLAPLERGVQSDCYGPAVIGAMHCGGDPAKIWWT